MAVKEVPFERLAEEFEKIYDNIGKEFKKTRAKSVKQAGSFMLKSAKKMVPRKNNDTYKGLKGYKQGTGYVVESSVPVWFPYNWWLDNRKTVDGVHYPNVQKTGVTGGGFFTKAKKLTEKRFSDIIIKDVSKWEIIK